MKIVLIGSGNVATQMGIALHEVGEEILQVYSPSINHASTLAKLINADPIDNLGSIIQHADLYVIAVKDSAIEIAVAALEGVGGLVVHTAGSIDISIISNRVEKAGVFYPLQTFDKINRVDFKNIPICIEAGDGKQLELLRDLALKLSNLVYEVDGEKRKVLHLAAVFACNFSNHMYTLANDILSKNGLEFDLIRPLIAESADKVQRSLPKSIQTGPAVRNDDKTILKHLDVLKNEPALSNIYQILSNSIKLVHE